MSERELPFLLEDIVNSIQNILVFTNGMLLDNYEADLKTRQAVERNFMIIGEAVARVPNEFKALHTKVNWRQVKDFRNFIVHDYFGIDNAIVWDIIQLSLPELLQEITLLRAQLPSA